MSDRRFPTSYWAITLAGVLSQACASTSRLALPASIREQADRYSVGGHVTLLQRKLRYGPYTVTKPFIYRSEDHREATLFNGQRERYEEHHHGKFELKTGSGVFRAKCEQATAHVIQHEKSLEYQRVNGEGGFSIRDDETSRAGARIYGCAIAQPSGSELRLTQRDDADGLVEGPGIHWELALLYKLEQPPALAAGLSGGVVVRDGGEVLGVVDNSYESASVTFARGLEPTTRDRLAAVAAALLLLRDM